MYLFTRRSRHFMTSDVSAIGQKSLDSVGLGSFGTGTIVDVFHKIGTVQRLREELKMSVNTGANCSAQCLRVLPQILSGPGLFRGLQRLKRWKTSDCLMFKTDAEGGGGSMIPAPASLPLSKRQKKLFSWFALSSPSPPGRIRAGFPLPLCRTLVMVLIPCHASRGLPDTRVVSIFCL